MAIAAGGYFSRWFTNHPEVASEYGVHWNFFWTIAFINIASSLASNIRHCFTTALGMYILYQAFLSFGGSNFIFTAPRDNFFTKNREGILGCIGYLCIFLFGVSYAEFSIKKYQVAKSGWMNPPATKTFIKLLPINFISGLSTFISISYIEPYSRR